MYVLYSVQYEYSICFNLSKKPLTVLRHSKTGRIIKSICLIKLFMAGSFLLRTSGLKKFLRNTLLLTVLNYGDEIVMISSF